jgi:hypothetical protein
LRGITDIGGYRGATLTCQRRDEFLNNKVFVEYVERKAKGICGPYFGKEEEAKEASLGLKRRLNRVFDSMGVSYEDRPRLVEKDSENPVKGKTAQPQKDKGPWKVAGKRKISEPEDVRMEHEMAKAVKRSRKAIFGGGESSAPCDSEGVSCFGS